MRRAAWLAVGWLAVAPPALGETFKAVVDRVSDGDTITVRVRRERVKVRLAEIDAPERGQPWGTRAKRALIDKVAGRDVEVDWRYSDRYGRRVGTVHCEGHDINRELVREGHAWVYRRHLRDRTLLDDEAHARAARVGLWSLPENERIPPWKWRAAARAQQR